MAKIVDNLFKVFTFLIYAVLYAPIILMIVFSFNDSRFLGGWRGFTTKWYQVLFSDIGIWFTMWNSVWIALTVTIITIVFAIPTSYVMSKYIFKGKSTIGGYLYVPMIIPEIAESLTIYLFFLWIDFPLGPLGIIVGQIVWFPIVYMVLRARMAGLNLSQVEEAARMLGANEFQTFFRVTLPLIMPGAIAGGLMQFTWSFDDFVKASFTRGIGFETLPIKIWNMAAKGGVTPEINALATFALILSIALAVVYTKVSR